MPKQLGDPDNIAHNLFTYVQMFSADVRDIFDHFEFQAQIDRRAKSGLLYQVAEKFAQIDLHPETVSNMQMGLVFEKLIRNFAEISNETAGEHLTPCEVIRLMINLIFLEDDEVLSNPPFGVEWQKVEKKMRQEDEAKLLLETPEHEKFAHAARRMKAAVLTSTQSPD